jgi:hypothetical protein
MQYRFPAVDAAGAERELIVVKRPGNTITLTTSGLPGSALGLTLRDSGDLGILLASLARFGSVDIVPDEATGTQRPHPPWPLTKGEVDA